MFLEIAQVDIKPGHEAEFEAGAAKAAPYFKRAKGCKAMSLHRSVEKPSPFQYSLAVPWPKLFFITVSEMTTSCAVPSSAMPQT